MWSIIILGTLIITFLYYLYDKATSRMKKLVEDIPHPKEYPLVGSIFEFGRTPVDFMESVEKLVKEHGPVVAVWIGTKLFIGISSADDIEVVCSSKSLTNKSFFYDFINPGVAMAADSGKIWQLKRKLLTPAFHFEILEQVIDHCNHNIPVLIDNLREEVGKPGFDIIHYLRECTLRILAESAMGVKIDTKSHRSIQFLKAIYALKNAIIYRCFNPWLFVEWIFRLSKHGKMYAKHYETIRSYAIEVIKARKQERIQMSSSMEANTGNKRRPALLDILLNYSETSDDLTDEQIALEVAGFMIVGHVTVADAIAFSLYGLMKNPEIQEKAVREMSTIYEDIEQLPTKDDLYKMKYLEKVIKESLRMWTPSALIGRSVTEDTTLKSGYTLPAGSTVVLSLHSLHHDPKEFPDPHVFDPERFNSSNSQDRHPFAYCPFSAGARNCIAQRYAMMEIKLILSTIIRNFKILPPVDLPDIKLAFTLTLESSTGVNVKITERVTK